MRNMGERKRMWDRDTKAKSKNKKTKKQKKSRDIMRRGEEWRDKDWVREKKDEGKENRS